MRDFIMTCRDKDALLSHLQRRNHLINDLDFFSLSNFVEAAQETLQEWLLELSETFIVHIKGCQVSCKCVRALIDCLLALQSQGKLLPVL
jgi:hypothetical protein